MQYLIECQPTNSGIPPYVEDPGLLYSSNPVDA
jgi:hypothetical protein